MVDEVEKVQGRVEEHLRLSCSLLVDGPDYSGTVGMDEETMVTEEVLPMQEGRKNRF